MVLIKILTSYIQVIGILGGIPARWPETIKSTSSLDNQVAVAKSDALSLDCLFGALRGDTPKYYYTAIISNIMPAFFMGLAIIFWFAWFIIKKKKFREEMFINKVGATLIIIGFNQQPAIITENLKAFQCKNLYRSDASVMYLKEDYDILCSSDEHKGYVGGLFVPMLLVWVFILPLLLYVIMRYN